MCARHFKTGQTLIFQSNTLFTILRIVKQLYFQQKYGLKMHNFTYFFDFAEQNIMVDNFFNILSSIIITLFRFISG